MRFRAESGAYFAHNAAWYSRMSGTGDLSETEDVSRLGVRHEGTNRVPDAIDALRFEIAALCVSEMLRGGFPKRWHFDERAADFSDCLPRLHELRRGGPIRLIECTANRLFAERPFDVDRTTAPPVFFRRVLARRAMTAVESEHDATVHAETRRLASVPIRAIRKFPWFYDLALVRKRGFEPRPGCPD